MTALSAACAAPNVVGGHAYATVGARACYAVVVSTVLRWDAAAIGGIWRAKIDEDGHYSFAVAL